MVIHLRELAEKTARIIKTFIWLDCFKKKKSKAEERMLWIAYIFFQCMVMEGLIEEMEGRRR